MTTFKPFANDEQEWTVGAGDGITLQNGTETLCIFGEAKFKADEQGKLGAASLLAQLKAISAHLPAGGAPKELWVKKSAGSLCVGGNIDLEKGSTGADALSKAISAIEKFGEVPAPAKNPKA